MKPGFQQSTLAVKTGDGLDDVLLEPLEFRTWDGKLYRAPVNGTTDGLSTPKIIRILPGYDATGDDWFSGVLHDSGYRNQLEVFQGVWVKANLTQQECDDLILEAMKMQGVGWKRRWTIFIALRLFGWKAFNDDRKKQL